MHAHSAFPDEGVFRLAVVSSLFPRLAADSRAAYRAAFGVIAVLLVVMAAAGLQAPVIAVSALAVPLLFLIYLYEVDPTEARFAVPTAAVFVTGAALGVAWGLVAGPVVSGSLIPQLAASLTTSGALASAVAVPVARPAPDAGAGRGGAAAAPRIAAKRWAASPPGWSERWA